MAYTLSDTELKLLKPLLGTLADRLSAAGCNDFHEFPKCFESEADMVKFIREFGEWNEETAAETEWSIKTRHLPDFCVLALLMARMYPEESAA